MRLSDCETSDTIVSDLFPAFKFAAVECLSAAVDSFFDILSGMAVEVDTTCALESS